MPARRTPHVSEAAARRARDPDLEVVVPDEHPVDALAHAPTAAAPLLAGLVALARQHGIPIPWEHRDESGPAARTEPVRELRALSPDDRPAP